MTTCVPYIHLVLSNVSNFGIDLNRRFIALYHVFENIWDSVYVFFPYIRIVWFLPFKLQGDGGLYETVPCVRSLEQTSFFR